MSEALVPAAAAASAVTDRGAAGLTLPGPGAPLGDALQLRAGER